MKKHTFLFLLIFLFPSSVHTQQRGELVFDSLLHFYAPIEIQSVYDEFDLPNLLFPIDYSVEMYKVVYRTPAATGDSLTLASGLVTVPVNNSCKFPLMTYNHGSLPYDSIISELSARFDQHLVGIPFSANGYVMALPDYLGYGATPLDHPHTYLHAQSSATATVDMLRAARELCSKVGTKLNDQVFLLGYSEGGYVTMAAHQELEAFHTDEFTITAAAPCSGPYDLSGISRDSFLFADRFAHPFFMAFVSLSYQYVYGNIYKDLESIFAEPYIDPIQRIFDRHNPETGLLSSLPYPALEMLNPLFHDDIVTDMEHPFNLALQKNDVYDWTSKAPVRLLYCKGDQKVPYENALFTAENMKRRGASDVQAVMVGEDENHEECTYPAIVMAKIWFDTYRLPCSSPTGEVAGAGSLYLYPNPFEETIIIGGRSDYRPDRLVVYDLIGRQVFSRTLHRNTTISIPDGALNSGSYIFEIQGTWGRYRQILIRM